MKQILQSLKTGATEVAEVPCPVVGHVILQAPRSLQQGLQRVGHAVGRYFNCALGDLAEYVPKESVTDGSSQKSPR